MSASKKIILQLNTDKTIELSDFSIIGPNKVQASIYMVQLDIRINYAVDFGDYATWKKLNPTKTWRDFVKNRFLNLFDAYTTSKTVKAMLDSEAT